MVVDRAIKNLPRRLMTIDMQQGSIEYSHLYIYMYLFVCV